MCGYLITEIIVLELTAKVVDSAQAINQIHAYFRRHDNFGAS